MASTSDTLPTTAAESAPKGPVPDDDLIADVIQLFSRISHLPDDAIREEKMRTSSTGNPSHGMAMSVFGIDRSSFSRWTTGRPDRHEWLTTRVINILAGDFTLFKKKSAQEVWRVFVQTAKPDVHADNERLLLRLKAHRTLLWEYRDKADRDERARRGQAKPSKAAAAFAESAGQPAIHEAAPSWAIAWAMDQVGGWARGLTQQQKTRVVVVYGGRKSGKGVLIEALYRQLKTDQPSSTVLHLSVSALVARLKPGEGQGPTHQRILDRLFAQLCPGQGTWPLAELHDFDAEMRAVLGKAPPGPIYLIISNADACLRLPDPAAVKHAVGSTTQLFGSLKPIAKPRARSPMDRVSIVVESSRPLSDLDAAYESSPFNIGVSYVLDRLNLDECVALATLAGLPTADGERLHAETGGHRALVWATLRPRAALGVVHGLPADLAAIQPVRITLNTLKEELELQPDLLRAFRQVCAGKPIDLDQGSVLFDSMYLAGPSPMACRAPLLQRALLAETVDGEAAA